MSQRTRRDDEIPDASPDTGERTTLRDPMNAATSGPAIGGEPTIPGTREHEQEVQHRKGKSPVGISAGLLWTVAILLIVVVVLIVYFS